jgi:hypothetical protein
MTKAESRENEFIVSLGCMVLGCSDPPRIHHDRRNGGKRKLSPKVAICHRHHSEQSNEGLHHIGIKAFERQYGSVSAKARWVEDQLTAHGLTPTWKKK